MSDRKNKPKKMRKRIQETSSSSDGSSSVSSDEDNDVSDLKPIREYMSDRREMAKQLFLSVKPEKLRMMLPQNLKKTETSELEDWCANELSGMSKARILSILNGQRMLESSESDDTIDSGPSLEIISDTEEWGDLSDVDVNSKDADRSSSSKTKSKKEKSKTRSEKTDKRDAKGKSHQKIKIEGNSRLIEESRVKKETKESKDKEGESLLDLLELEMRARAIRALIRKEEDIIPTAPESFTSTKALTSKPSSVLDKNRSTRTILEDSLPQSSQLSVEGRVHTMKVVRDRIQEMDSTLARVGSTHDASEEEDVVLVVQPTTTIELLSSESESESQNKRVNQRLENERYNEAEQPKDSRVDASGSKNPETVEKSPQKTNNLETFKKFKRKTRDKGKEENSNNLHSKKSNNSVTSSETSNPTTGSSSPKTLSKDHNTAASSESTSNSATDDPSTSKTVESTTQREDAVEKEDQVQKVTESEETNAKIEPEMDDRTNENNDKSNIKSDIKTAKVVENYDNGAEDDKSTDLELIINLDDYPDDMEDTEPKKTVATSTVKAVQSKTESSNGVPAETWATRYYQTDDVQNVIKESKIQSEIRKRLRERQRLARLNVPSSTVGAVPSSNTTAMTTAEKVEATPTTGSVEEYMALKQITPGVEANASTVGNDNSVAETKPTDVTAEAAQESTLTN